VWYVKRALYGVRKSPNTFFGHSRNDDIAVISVTRPRFPKRETFWRLGAIPAALVVPGATDDNDGGG